MAGVNPYITKVEAPLPTKPFTVTFIVEETNERKEFVVDPTQLPYGRIGLTGSILDLAQGADIEIDHSCGGVCACATCHVHVLQGLKSCSPATENEEDQLDTARDVQSESRLSCQCVPNGTQDLVVRIPKWNKNLVKEDH